MLAPSTTPSPVACTVPTHATPKNYLDRVDSLTDLIVTAFKCDITRVATLDLGRFDGQFIGSHTLAHVTGSGEPGPEEIAVMNMKPASDAACNSKLGAIINKMKAVPEGNGTMFDNTAILWANHLSDGYHHASIDLPWILAGSCGGYFKTGRMLEFPVPATGSNYNAFSMSKTGVNGIFFGLAQAMGISTVFGDTKYAKDPLPGLTGG